MNFFDQQTLYDLEFSTIQEWLEDLGIGVTAKERLRNLKPNPDFRQLKLDLLKLKEFHTIRTDGESFPGMDYDELKKEIRILPVYNADLEQEGLVRIVRAAELVNAILVFFDKREKDFPELNFLLQEV